MNPYISYISGIIAAFTPCVLVLMPLLLYRFFNREKKEWINFGIFMAGYIFSYVLFGYVLSGLFTSFIQNGVKIGLGILFLALGILSFFNKINPLEFPLLKNPFLYGMSFALIVSINPCTLPYIGTIVGISNISLIFLNMLFFSLGIITPAIMFAFVGRSILNINKKSGKFFNLISHLMSIILILSGAYLAYSIKDITQFDIYAAAFLLIISFMLLLKSFFIIRQKKDLLNIRTILLLISLILIISTVIFQCSHIVLENNNDSSYMDLAQISTHSCNGNVESCDICHRCITIFAIAALIGIMGILSVYYTNKSLSF